VTEPAVAAADALLRKHGVRYLVVGGQAIAQEAATTTRDVDVMVTTADYRKAVEQLGKDPALTLAWQGGPVTRFGIVAQQGIPLDVVDAGVFSGTKAASEFFEFLVREHSIHVEGIRYLSPDAVWYTRLLTKRWKAYAEKIVTNIIDGLSPDHLNRVAEIARQFGTERVLQERLDYVRQELKRPDLEPLLRKK